MWRSLISLVAVLGLMACAQPATSTYGVAPVGAGSTAQLVKYPRFGDSDPHEWDRRSPRSYPIHGIDVSRWQGEIDWPKARRSGVSFAYLKATEGGDVLDPRFTENWRQAKRAGVPRGAYHYFYFCRPAAEQARWFIRNVPRDGRALPHVLDMEWNHRSKTCTKRPSGAKVRAEARRFLSILERHYGKRPVVYTTVDFYRDTGIGNLPGTEFWLRSVAGHPAQVYPRQDWVFWQYTGTGQISGISGDVDINVFRGSAQAWVQWLEG
ncbi:glycoside hydrolase [Epibacterium sp. SM1979]|uniref:Glycoside hydrolase n=1 Tax=Tritonibacter litoralis TaxID=2662264 RepID=A0A843YHT8_9RHOB|nr:GH25 family lysozyme [Tritonibacter litoralis]MQQ08709.1 glycoside hydrolase [Tritonibacter litoralis]